MTQEQMKNGLRHSPAHTGGPGSPGPALAAHSGPEKITLKRNGLTIDCFFGEGGKLRSKVERWGGQSVAYDYVYDASGHLLQVLRDDQPVEDYTYNEAGQRSTQRREYRGFGDSAEGRLMYDAQGRLIQAGNTAFSYDATGALAERRNQQGVTRFFYGADTMLDRVLLPSKTEIRYEYDQSNPVGPARRFRNGNLTTEYIWLDLLRLSAYRDHDHRLEYTFLYDAAGALDRLRIAPLPSDKIQRPGPRTDWAAYSADWVGTASK